MLQKITVLLAILLGINVVFAQSTNLPIDTFIKPLFAVTLLLFLVSLFRKYKGRSKDFH